MKALEEKPFFKRTARLFAFIFLGQLGIIFLLSGRPLNVLTPSRETFRASLQTGSGTEIPLPASLFARNPLFFALANEDNFSGQAWLKFQPPAYKPVPFHEPPAWLEVQDLEFGVSSTSGTNTPLQLFQLRAPDKPVVFLPPVTPMMTASFFRIDGPDSRNAKLPEELPSIRHVDVIRPTLMEIGINALGLVVSARVLEKSGLPAADQTAISAANQLRFDSVDGPPLEWVRILFYWHIVPPETAPK
jgi:hypothetical protein